MLRPVASRATDEPGNAATGAGNQPAATAAHNATASDNTTRANSPGTADECYRSSSGACAEYSARGSESDPATATAGIAGNKREPVASAIGPCNHVS